MWTERMDAMLDELRRDGASMSKIAAQLGVSRNAVIGRFHRRNGTVFPSERRAKEEATAKRVQREAAQSQRVAHGLRTFRKLLNERASRNSAIVAALANGATLQAIAEELGITRSRVSQIRIAWTNRRIAV